MSTGAEPTSHDPTLVAAMAAGGTRFEEAVVDGLVARGAGIVPDLIGILEDPAMALETAPGAGYAPIYAARVLGRLGATEAIEPLLRVLEGADALQVIYGELVTALSSLGPPALEPTLAAHARSRSGDGRTGLARVLASLGVRDDRILAVLLRTLAEEPARGASMLVEYGDERALPALGEALDRQEPSLEGGLFEDQDIIEIERAIAELGGSLTEAQTTKVEMVAAARASLRAKLQRIAAAELGAGDRSPPARRQSPDKKRRRKLKKQAQRRNRR